MQINVEETLVVTDIKIGLCPIIGDENPRDFSRFPRDEAVRPLPREEATPPVTNRCFVVCGFTGDQINSS